MNTRAALAILTLFAVGAFAWSQASQAAHGIDTPDDAGEGWWDHFSSGIDWNPWASENAYPLWEDSYFGGEAVNSPYNAGAMSDAGLQRLTQIEGFSATPYPDPPGQTVTYSIYYGHQIQPGESFNGSREEGEIYLRQDIAIAEDAIRRNVTVPLNQNQFDALVSFVYNIGASAFRNSTLLKRLNSGDYAGVAEEMRRWTKANKKELPALVQRREHEIGLFYA